MAASKITSMLYPVCRVVTPAGSGSGVFISDTFILTVFHCLKDSITIVGTPNQVKEIRHTVTCEVFNSQKKKPVGYPADIYAYDEAQDIALLKLKKDKYKYSANLMDVSKADVPEVFDEVYVIGASFGHEPLPTRGIITYKKEEIDYGFYWMTDAKILVGNSGGGVFMELNNQYVLIGITTSMIVDDETDQSTHLTHFIPPQVIHNFLQNLKIGLTVSNQPKVI